MVMQNQALVSRANQFSPLEGIGSEINKTKNLLKCVYDFAALGGALGDIALLDDQGNPAVLPAGAIVTRSWANVLTTVASLGAATVALKLLAGADLMAATAKGSLLSSAPFVEGKQDGTAANFVGPVVAVAGTSVKATIGGAALTAGKIQYFLEYVIQ